MALNNNVYRDENNLSIGDATELALYEYALAHGFDKLVIEKECPKIAEIPFDSERKCMTTIHQCGDKYIAFVKGAMEMVMHEAKDEPNMNLWKNSLHSMLSEGLRVLGFAMKEFDTLPSEIVPDTIENNLTIIGIAGIIDPPRKEAEQAVNECKTAGIQPVMISGDHPTTAVTIAKRLGILETKEDRIITGAEMNATTEEELQKIVDHIKVYARVSPEQKLLIVKALQKKGEYVAMTGDGVNDAPALRHADIALQWALPERTFPKRLPI